VPPEGGTRVHSVRDPPAAAGPPLRGLSWKGFVLGAGEDGLTGVLGGNGVVSAEEVALPAATANDPDEDARLAEARGSAHG
jgi:hypothetical protein